VLQHLLLLLHAHRLAVGHPDVRLLVVGHLYLASRGMGRCYTMLATPQPPHKWVLSSQCQPPKKNIR
jgi:hypothetical protein